MEYKTGFGFLKFSLLLELLRDPNIAVRDTTAWTIGRIFEFVSQAVMNDELLRAIGQALVNGLGDVPRVATNICWVNKQKFNKFNRISFVSFYFQSFSSLARAAYDNAECPEDDDTPATYLLSPFFDEIVKTLIETTER